MEYLKKHFNEAVGIIKDIDYAQLEKIVKTLVDVRKNNGRLFFLGVGGSAANASHAVNDFRKICQMEAYTPTDNVAELTARTNDDGWDSVFEAWLKGSQLNNTDCIFVFSVGGGNKEKNVSVNLIYALDYAQTIGARIVGVVGRDGGYTAKVADVCCIVPVVNSKRVTPHTEAFQALVWHALVSHPDLQIEETKWESVK